jgi:hypothetical protein
VDAAVSARRYGDERTLRINMVSRFESKRRAANHKACEAARFHIASCCNWRIESDGSRMARIAVERFPATCGPISEVRVRLPHLSSGFTRLHRRVTVARGSPINAFKGRTFPRLFGIALQPASALSHQLNEREADLVGAYFLEKHEPPAYQYAPGTAKNIEL